MISIAQQESSSYKLERWKSNDGLPQNSVNAILKSSDGYLWIGTYGGLAKFDGLSFQRITSSGLVYERIISLFEDSKQTIWVGCENNGLFAIQQDTIIRYKTESNGVSDIIELSNGDIIAVVQTKGLARVEADQLNYFATDRLEGTRIDQAILSRRNMIWLNTSEGVFQFNPSDLSLK